MPTKAQKCATASQVKVVMSAPISRSHTFSVLSSEADAARTQLRQSFYRPTLAVRAPDEVVGLRKIEFHLLRVPLQRGLGKARSDASQQNGLRERTGVGEAGGGFTLPPAG